MMMMMMMPCRESRAMPSYFGLGSSQSSPLVQPSFSFETIITLVLANMVDCEEGATVKTLSGPGGRTGPLRIDLDGRWHGGPGSVMREYAEAEARSAYTRWDKEGAVKQEGD